MPDRQSVGSGNPLPVTRGYWLFLVAIVAGPFLPLVSNTALLLHLFILAVQCPWRSSLAEKRIATVGLCLLLCCCWLVIRIDYPLGLGLHTLARPFRFPVTVLDYVPYLLFFFARSLIPISRREVLWTLWAVVFANLLRFPVAVIQKYLSWTCRSSWEVLGVPVVRLFIRPMHQGRVDAAFANGNILACSLVFCLLAAAGLLCWYLPLRRQTSMEGPPSQRLALSTLTVASLCAGSMLVWSGSRNAWMVIALVLPVLARFAGLSWRHIMVPLLLVLLLVGVAVVDLGTPTAAARLIVPKIVWGRIIGLPELKPSRLSWRAEVFATALDMIAERPWAGWGIGGFTPEAELRTGFPKVNHAHNIFLQLATETGIPFTVFFSGVVGAVFLSAGRRLRSLPRDPWRSVLGALYMAAVAMVLLHQLSLTMLHSNQLEMLFWWCLAVPYSLALTGSDSSASDAASPKTAPVTRAHPSG